MKEYIIQSGDSFFNLAKQNDCTCQEIIDINPEIDPNHLQIGQKIRMPLLVVTKHTGGCAGFSGKGTGPNRCDDVLVDLEGVKFRVTRMGEPSIPHELHLILPRTEIRKVEYPGTGIIETNIMVSNINIVNSPRFEGEARDRAENSQAVSNQGTSNQEFSNQTENNVPQFFAR